MKAFFSLQTTRRFPNLRVLQSTWFHDASASRSNRCSYVRWQTTEAKSKSVFYRASGFERGTNKKAVWNIIKHHLRKDEEELPVDITVLPTCGSTRDDSSIAIIRFPKHRQPDFLAELVDNPLGEKVVTSKTDDGTLRYVVFDRHFHGFTQLYATSNDKPVRAE
jgi:hypothetical protein